MFRIPHLIRITNSSTRIILARHTFQITKGLVIQHNHLLEQIRCCSKDCKDPPEKKVDLANTCSQPKKVTPKVILKECKPVPIHPCKPPRPDVNEPLPYISECPKDQTDKLDCPHIKQQRERECPYDDPPPGSGWDKSTAWLGLFIAAGTLGMLYYLGFFDKKEKKVKEVKVVKQKKKRVVIKNPANISEIPQSVPYLLIGGGTASFAAFRAIKSAEPQAKVLVISDESFNPYMRPPLSKEMWFNDDENSVKKHIFKQWNGSERNLYYEPEDFYIRCKELLTSENGGVAVARGYSVSHIDVLEKIAYIGDYEIHYDKCLIATGARPKSLSVFDVAASSDPKVEERVKYYRNIFDFEEVYENFEESKTIAIIGAGFLGSELACAIARKAKKTKEVHQIFRENGNMGKILPEYLSNWTTNKVRSEGVNVICGTEVIGVKFEKDKLKLILSNNNCLYVDHAIVAVGVDANTELAKDSDLEVDPELGGFLVNTELQARTDLWVAGDCACFYDARLGRRRIEHHDHAVVTGRLAGENMTGCAKPYLHQSMFWSDLGPDVGYEAIGVVDSSLPTVGVFAKATDADNPQALLTETGEGLRSDSEAQGTALPSEECKKSIKPNDNEDYGKGIIFYLRDDIVVGIVLWNVFNRMSIARQVLKDERKYDDLNEVAKLFKIHEE